MIGHVFLGGQAFCDRMQALIDCEPRSVDIPKAQRRIVTPSFDFILEVVMKEFAITSRSDLQRKSRGVARKTLAHLAWREGGLPMTAIAQWLGVSGSAVSKMIRTFRDHETSDRTYRQVIKSLRNTLNNP